MTDTASVSADPKWVSTHFTAKYYDVLQKYPEYLQRFYKEESMFSITDMQPDSPVPQHHASSLEAIQDVVNTTIAGAEAKLQHVDAQFSIHGGVVLQVTGDFKLKGAVRPFVQTFFLATQEMGFYIHNDMLRLFPESTAAVPALGVPVAAGSGHLITQAAKDGTTVPAVAVPAPAAPPMTTQVPAATATASAAAAASTNEPVKPSSPTPAAPPRAMPAVSDNARPEAKPVQTPAAPAQPAKPAQAVSAPPAKPVPAAAQTTPTQTPPAARQPSATRAPQPEDKAPAAAAAPAPTQAKSVAAAPPQQPAQPTTWAARLKNPSHGPATEGPVKAQAAAAPVPQHRQPSPGPVMSDAAPTANGNHVQRPNTTANQPANQPANQHGEEPEQQAPVNQGHYVQVKNLPTEHLQHELLEAEFSKFGPLFKRGHGYAITIHNLSREQGGGKVAYVKFESAAAAEAACAGHVSILGRVVEVVKHEGGFPNYHRGPGRGGYRGRGGNYRGDHHRTGSNGEQQGTGYGGRGGGQAERGDHSGERHDGNKPSYRQTERRHSSGAGGQQGSHTQGQQGRQEPRGQHQQGGGGSYGGRGQQGGRGGGSQARKDVNQAPAAPVASKA